MFYNLYVVFSKHYGKTIDTDISLKKVFQIVYLFHSDFVTRGLLFFLTSKFLFKTFKKGLTFKMAPIF